MCTGYLLEDDINFCDLIGVDENNNGDGGEDEYYCAPAGSYDFETQFILPESSLGNFAVNGVTFRIYVLINNEFTCHAQFTTVRSYEMTYSILGVAAVFASFLSILVGVKRHKQRKLRTTAKVNLQMEEQRQDHVVDFGAPTGMQDHYVVL